MAGRLDRGQTGNSAREQRHGDPYKAQVAERATVRRPWHNRFASRPAFTLVEMLVVITIIGILMAMVFPAIAAAMRAAQDTAIMTEVFKLDAAVKMFESKFSRYPPDGTSAEDTARFVNTTFPDPRPGAAKPPADLDPARAVVYWLSQVSTDAMNPFGPPVATDGPSGPKAVYDFFSFATDRVRNGLYHPLYSDPKNDPPYVYFCSTTYRVASYKFGKQQIRPYHYGPTNPNAPARSRAYAAADTFQIIAAGRNNEFGRGGRVYSDEPAAGDDWIAPADEDNIVNFDTRLVGDIRR
jgi:prepilin-type N-terminal cleavage/methylation domain-containing protein